MMKQDPTINYADEKTQINSKELTHYALIGMNVIRMSNFTTCMEEERGRDSQTLPAIKKAKIADKKMIKPRTPSRLINQLNKPVRLLL